jgi:hypothetical protein
MRQHSQRQHKSKAWLSLTLAAMTLLFLSTLALALDFQTCFTQVRFELMSSDPDMSNRKMLSHTRIQRTAFAHFILFSIQVGSIRLV